MVPKFLSTPRSRRQMTDLGIYGLEDIDTEKDPLKDLEDPNDEEDDRWQGKTKRRSLQYILLLIAIIGITALFFKPLVTHYANPPLLDEIATEKQGKYFNGSDYFNPTVILISLDGFRNDYLERGVTPYLSRLAERGVSARYMTPSFPSITFPNHWTLATGLYPEAHGVVANDFHDPVLQQNFYYKKPAITDHPKWWGGEPIWQTSRKQGKISAAIMWPGSTVPTMQPNYVITFNLSITVNDKMDIALSWLDFPIEKRPEVIAMYVPDVDQKGHGGGPDGPQMNATLSKVDRAINKLLKGLEQRNLDSHVHVVVVSDHGMAPTHKTRLIYYDDILSKESLSFLRNREGWPLLDLRPKDGAPAHATAQIFQELYNYTQRVAEPHFQVYMRENVPERFHYRADPRITPIVTIPDIGYSFTTHKEFDINSGKDYRPRGIHGYDNLEADMRSIFMAQGPRIVEEFGRGTILEPFQNIEVYDFVANLLELQSAPNNGTLSGRFLKEAVQSSGAEESTPKV